MSVRRLCGLPRRARGRRVGGGVLGENLGVLLLILGCRVSLPFADEKGKTFLV